MPGIRHRGEVLSASEVSTLRSLVERYGEAETTRRLKLAPQTFARAVAQLHLQRVTCSHIRYQLQNEAAAAGGASAA